MNNDNDKNGNKIRRKKLAHLVIQINQLIELQLTRLVQQKQEKSKKAINLKTKSIWDSIFSFTSCWYSRYCWSSICVTKRCNSSYRSCFR